MFCADRLHVLSFLQLCFILFYYDVFCYVLLCFVLSCYALSCLDMRCILKLCAACCVHLFIVLHNGPWACQKVRPLSFALDAVLEPLRYMLHSITCCVASCVVSSHKGLLYFFVCAASTEAFCFIIICMQSRCVSALNTLP